MQILNKNQLAQSFEVSTNAINGWLSRGCPYVEKGAKGKSWKFNLPDVIKWHKSYFLKDKDHDEEDQDGEVLPLSKARALREHYQALLKRTEYEKGIGQLVEAKEVQDAAFKTARKIRDALLNVPNRITSVLAGELKAEIPNKIHEILDKEIRHILEELPDDAIGK